jgi:hypothetical protein
MGRLLGVVCLTDSRLILAVVTRVPGSQVWELEATGSGGFCEEFQRLGRQMRQEESVYVVRIFRTVGVNF